MRVPEYAVADHTHRYAQDGHRFNPEIPRYHVVRLSGSFRIRIVAYLRNHFEFMLSNYKGRVKTSGYYKSFDLLLRENVHLRDYSMLLDRWIGVFGRASVDITSSAR